MADESAADAADPAAADSSSSSKSSSVFEKTSSGAQGVSYTSGDGRSSSTLTFAPSSGSRFWSLACVCAQLHRLSRDVVAVTRRGCICM